MLGLMLSIWRQKRKTTNHEGHEVTRRNTGNQVLRETSCPSWSMPLNATTTASYAVASSSGVLPYYGRFRGRNKSNLLRNREGSAVRAEILKINSETPEDQLVKYAADQIRSGEVLGMPTDTFYGLAADPLNLRAVERVYEIKSRFRHKPLSLLIESVDQAEEMAFLPDFFYELAKKFWPGPLTMIVKAASRLPLKVTANTGNVALRVPSAKIPLAIIRAAGIPITATSANLSGAAECTTAEQ